MIIGTMIFETMINPSQTQTPKVKKDGGKQISCFTLHKSERLMATKEASKIY